MSDQDFDPAKYFCNFGCCYWHEYPSSYGIFDVWRGATVVAVGADCGSTFVYLSALGAERFIGYEKEDRLREVWSNEVCRRFDLCNRAEMRGEWKGEDLPPGDVLIVDCEGCEAYLTPRHLAQYQHMFIAVHDWLPADARRRLGEMLKRCARVFVTPDGREEMYYCRGEYYR